VFVSVKDNTLPPAFSDVQEGVLRHRCVGVSFIVDGKTTEGAGRRSLRGFKGSGQAHGLEIIGNGGSAASRKMRVLVKEKFFFILFPSTNSQ